VVRRMVESSDESELDVDGMIKDAEGEIEDAEVQYDQTPEGEEEQSDGSTSSSEAPRQPKRVIPARLDLSRATVVGYW